MKHWTSYSKRIKIQIWRRRGNYWGGGSGNVKLLQRNGIFFLETQITDIAASERCIQRCVSSPVCLEKQQHQQWKTIRIYYHYTFNAGGSRRLFVTMEQALVNSKMHTYMTSLSKCHRCPTTMSIWTTMVLCARKLIHKGKIFNSYKT